MSICYFVDQRLLSFYALLFTWVDVFATEFPDVFDREEIVDWIKQERVEVYGHTTRRYLILKLAIPVNMANN